MENTDRKVENEREGVSSSKDVRNQDEQEVPDKGSQDLIEKYNINDQAHSNSSKKDFIDTVSNFHHADETQNDSQENSEETDK